MIDSCREIDFALKYVSVESFARDEECFKLPSSELTQTAVQTYLFGELADTSISHRERIKSIVSGFAEWLIGEALLTRNPTR